MALQSALSESVRAQASWWRTPQRLWLRRAIFQVHLWVGLLLTIYVVVIGLSGSALVFSQELEKAMQGEALQIVAQTTSTTIDQSVRAITASRPHFIAVGLEDLDRPDRPVTLLMRPNNAPATSDYRMVSFNRNTGEVLLDRRRYSGVLGWFTNLHFYLLSGTVGLQVSGYMALGLLLLCASGLILWWPGVRRWMSALTLRRRSSWQRFNWDLHSVVGFWCCAALSIVTFTGIYFAFPGPVKSFMYWVTGSSSAIEPKAKTTQSPANRIVVMTIDQAIAAANRALPSDAPASYVQLPATPESPYSVTGYYANTAPYSQLVQISLDPHTAQVLNRTDTRSEPLGAHLIQYFFTVHAGSFAGPGLFGVVVKGLWVALGIAPALLAVTGFLMYWNRVLARLLSKFPDFSR